jgi:protocatechuate 3,4-dioxygenase beta subunit
MSTFILRILLLLFFPVILHAQLIPTPFVYRGPLFPPNHEEARDNDLTEVVGCSQLPKGTIVELRGTIRATNGELVSDAEVLIWQTDNLGNYNHPEAAKMMGKEKLDLDPCFQYWGKTISDQNGNYFFKTILPKPYLISDFQRPAHIHFQVKHKDYKYLSTELHFPNDQYLSDDQITEDLNEEEHLLLMAKITQPPNGFGAKIIGFNMVLKKNSQENNN